MTFLIIITNMLEAKPREQVRIKFRKNEVNQFLPLREFFTNKSELNNYSGKRCKVI